MNRWCAYMALALVGSVCSGCGTQRVILGTRGEYLLTARDVLALPTESIELVARLQGGDLLEDQVARVLLFERDGELYRAAETNDEGAARVHFIPEGVGDYRFTVVASPAGLPDDPPAPQPLLVTIRPPDTPIIIVDLDKTVVASGFHRVLIGNPDPMDGSAELLRRLAESMTVVYLTHRPEYFGIKSKSWLRENGYPRGPVLLSSTGGFLKGSGAYKSEMLADLQERFTNIQVGIGDMLSDAIAYHRNGIRGFLIVQIGPEIPLDDLRDLQEALEEAPEEIEVVTEWAQIARALFEDAHFPPSAMAETVRTIVEERERPVEEQP